MKEYIQGTSHLDATSVTKHSKHQVKRKCMKENIQERNHSDANTAHRLFPDLFIGKDMKGTFTNNDVILQVQMPIPSFDYLWEPHYCHEFIHGIIFSPTN